MLRFGLQNSLKATTKYKEKDINYKVLLRLRLKAIHGQ